MRRLPRRESRPDHATDESCIVAPLRQGLFGKVPFRRQINGLGTYLYCLVLRTGVSTLVTLVLTCQLLAVGLPTDRTAVRSTLTTDTPHPAPFMTAHHGQPFLAKLLAQAKKKEGPTHTHRTPPPRDNSGQAPHTPLGGTYPPTTTAIHHCSPQPQPPLHYS